MLPTFTIAPLKRSLELYWKLDTGSIEHGHGYTLHQSVTRAESSLSMIKKGRIQGFLRGSWRTFHWKKLVIGRRLYVPHPVRGCGQWPIWQKQSLREVAIRRGEGGGH